MAERLQPSETGAQSDWESFLQKNNDITLLQERDTELFEIVKEFYDIQQLKKNALYKQQDKEAMDRLKGLSEKLDEVEEERYAKLTPFFEKIRGV